jgi:hypothetical protein
MVHILTCIFYVVGRQSQLLPNGLVLQGWVEGQSVAEGGTWDDSTELETRYVASTYFALNALENSNTE